jgi:hypothetical protein
MPRFSIICILAVGSVISGCAGREGLSPLSFAPPEVALADSNGDKFFKTTVGAIELVDQFIVAYRDAQSANADARQGFEVPAFIATLGAIAATAFGGGRDGVLVGGTASALFRSGNAYYAPKSKAAMYDSALDGMFCIQQIATGAKPLEVVAASSEGAGADEPEDPTVYYLIRNGALSVERILKVRLSNAGSLTDASGIAAEYEASVKKELDARAKVTAANDADDPDADELSAEKRMALITELQEKIQQCVLRAKI